MPERGTVVNGPSRPTRRSEAAPATSSVLLEAALGLFHSVGYHGASVRDIARTAGVTVAAVYHHFGSKQDLLVQLMTRAMTDSLLAVESAAATSKEPAEQLAAMVSSVVDYHLVHQAEAFVGNSELRSLERDGLLGVVSLRDREEHLFVDVIMRGAQEGRFEVAEPTQAARAIIAMCSAVANWYKPGGRLSRNEICRQYVRMSLNLVRSA